MDCPDPDRVDRLTSLAAICIVALTLCNLAVGGRLSLLLYAVPVAIAARCGLRLGLAFAALATFSAWAAGPISNASIAMPALADAAWIFVRLGLVAVGMRWIERALARCRGR